MYVAFDFNSMHFDERDFASSRLRVSQKLWGTRRREGAKEGDSSMIVEEVSSVVVDTAFHGELLDEIYVTMSSYYPLSIGGMYVM